MVSLILFFLFTCFANFLWGQGQEAKNRPNGKIGFFLAKVVLLLYISDRRESKTIKGSEGVIVF